MPINPAVSAEIMDARMIGNVSQDNSFRAIDAIMNLDIGKMFTSHSTNYGVESDPAMAKYLPHVSDTPLATTLRVNTILNMAIGEYMIEQTEQDMALGVIPPDAMLLPPEEIENLKADDKRLSEFVSGRLAADPALSQVGLQALREKGYIEDGTPEAKYADRVLDFFDKRVKMDDIDGGVYDGVRDYFKNWPSAAEMSAARPEDSAPRDSAEMKERPVNNLPPNSR